MLFPAPSPPALPGPITNIAAEKVAGLLPPEVAVAAACCTMLKILLISYTHW